MTRDELFDLTARYGLTCDAERPVGRIDTAGHGFREFEFVGPPNSLTRLEAACRAIRQALGWSRVEELVRVRTEAEKNRHYLEVSAFYV